MHSILEINLPTGTFLVVLHEQLENLGMGILWEYSGSEVNVFMEVAKNYSAAYEYRTQDIGFRTQTKFSGWDSDNCHRAT